jgi:hypothetical protein
MESCLNVIGLYNKNSRGGKAGMGNTGQVISKVVGKNEALMRDRNSKRLQADTAKQLAWYDCSSRLERIAADHKGCLLEANFTKKLLASKEH